MKLLIIVGLFFSCSAASVKAYEYGNIGKDINSGLLPIEAAKKAHQDDAPSENVVQEMVDANVDVVKAVQTVAKEWSSCEDTYASVKKGVQIAPERAGEIVAAVATIKGCKCNAQSFWAKSKIQQRLRPRISRALVEISSTCSCASAGVEAAIDVVPNQAENMIDAVIVAKNRADRTVDSIGQVGKIPKQKYWGENAVKTKNSNLVRNTDVCKGDHNELDDYKTSSSWSNSDKKQLNSDFDSNELLGHHNLLCKDEEENKNQDEDKAPNTGVLISQYIEGQGNNQALELYNDSDQAIDLLTDNYQLEVFFHGYEFPGEVIQLKGKIEPNSTFVISDANAAADIANVSNQKVNGLVFKGADAVVLKTGFNTNPCECAASTVAAAINGTDKSNNNQEQPSEAKKDFIKRMEQHYENTEVQTSVVDTIGRILVNDDKENKETDHPIVEDKTLRRIGNTCKGDRIEMDEFVINQEWDTHSMDDFSDVGSYSKQDCSVSRPDLILSEYIEGSENNAMIELFNGTDRPIDFENEKYLLEIYNDDDDEPEQKIYLKGQIEKNGVFVITNNDAEDALLDKAHQSTGDLNLTNSRSVVLKKVVLPAYQSCYADIANWLTRSNNKRIAYTLTPIFDPGVDPSDGDEGGELASPN